MGEVKHFNYDNLSMKFYIEFLYNGVNFTESDIDNKITELRTYAALNSIDDKAVLEYIKESLQPISDFHKNRLHEHQDMNSLYRGLKKCGISTAGLFISYLIFKNSRNLARKFKVDEEFIRSLPILTVGLSLFPAVFSCLNFYHWRNPRHQEIYEALSLIISRFEHALVTEIVIEKK